MAGHEAQLVVRSRRPESSQRKRACVANLGDGYLKPSLMALLPVALRIRRPIAKRSWIVARSRAAGLLGGNPIGSQLWLLFQMRCHAGLLPVERGASSGMLSQCLPPGGCRPHLAANRLQSRLVPLVAYRGPAPGRQRPGAGAGQGAAKPLPAKIAPQVQAALPASAGIL